MNKKLQALIKLDYFIQLAMKFLYFMYLVVLVCTIIFSEVLLILFAIPIAIVALGLVIVRIVTMYRIAKVKIQ